MANDMKLQKGYAAPLEGAVGREIASVLSMAFSLIGLRMLGGLGMKLGVKPAGSSLFAGVHHAGANPPVAGVKPPEMHSTLPTPKPPSAAMH